jgi:hypothetical protein
LNDARGKRQRITLTFKKLAGGDALFSYTQRNLLVRDLRMIGPQLSATTDK